VRLPILLLCLLAACARPVLVSSYHLLTAPDADLVVASDGSGDFRTISAALAQARPGALILVRPGRYREAVTLSSGVRLIGSGPDLTVIDAGGEPAALTLRDSGSVVHGLRLVSAGGQAAVVTAGRHRFERCLIAGNARNGVIFSAMPGVGAEFSHCTIADNPGSALHAPLGPASLSVNNCIIAFNGRAAVTDSTVGLEFFVSERTCFYNQDTALDRSLAGRTGILADPGFVSRLGDYRLTPDSPCLGKARQHRDPGCFW